MSNIIEKILLISAFIVVAFSFSFWMGLYGGLIPIGVASAIYFANKAAYSTERKPQMQYIILFVLSIALAAGGVIAGWR